MNSARAGRRFRRQAVGTFCLVLSGVGIGWLMGLSMSPILHIVVAGILTAVASVVSALSGFGAPRSDATKAPVESGLKPTDGPDLSAARNDQRRPATRIVTVVPLASFVVGIVLGSSVGVYARSHDWLSPEPQAMVAKWRLTKLTDEQIANRLFDLTYPAVGGKSDQVEEKKKSATALYSSVPSDELRLLKSAPDVDLRRFMLSSKNQRVINFAKRCDNVVHLRAAVEELLWPEQP